MYNGSAVGCYDPRETPNALAKSKRDGATARKTYCTKGCETPIDQITQLNVKWDQLDGNAPKLTLGQSTGLIPFKLRQHDNI